MAEYPLDWTVLPVDRPLYEAEVDLSGPVADYDAHLSVMRDAAVRLPAVTNQTWKSRAGS
ncbi:hypothetical protein [Streptomyces yangpuensis]|uniref:hypothetical protein n=1 Tax=Streptomyces yangpuensis TaxID=1648182 RepID=UPI00371911A6